MSSVIVIPVYKPQPSKDEICSLLQCYKVLGCHNIVLCCPESLNTIAYEEILGKEVEKVCFSDYYFTGIAGYNELMLSSDFYKKFERYEYMLIYQLDAFVFSDELQKWCDEGYDYIGAPWFKYQKTHESGHGLWCCGNGGFSLRKVQKFIEITDTALVRDLKTSKEELWEDVLFSVKLKGTPHELNIPTAEKAMKFSFEASPAYLYEQTEGKLPFGCHAWRKFDFNTFWSQFIPAEPTLNVSIVTITYNDLANLKKTRNSILSQTFKDYEWIIIDGGSSDGTKEFLESNPEGITYWCSEKDKGVYDAQNKGTRIANGEYVIYMNAGDCFHDADVLQNVFSTQRTGDVLYGDWINQRETGKKQYVKSPSEIVFPSFYSKNICHQAMFIKTSLIKNSPYDLSYEMYADWAKWMELSYQGKVFEKLPYCICIFQLGGASSAAENKKRKELERLRIEYYPGSLKTLAIRYNNRKGANPEYLMCKSVIKDKTVSNDVACKTATIFITNMGNGIGNKFSIITKFLWYRLLCKNKQR